MFQGVRLSMGKGPEVDNRLAHSRTASGPESSDYFGTWYEMKLGRQPVQVSKATERFSPQSSRKPLKDVRGQRDVQVFIAQGFFCRHLEKVP